MSIDDAGTGLCEDLWINGVCAGLVTGGRLNDAGAIVHRRGMRGRDRIRGAMYTPGGSPTFIFTGDSTWLNTSGGIIMRSDSGFPCSALTEFTVDFQGPEDTVRYDSCKTNSISLECAVGDALSGTLDFQSKADPDTGETGSGEPGYHWEWSDAECTLEGVAYALQRFTINFDNGLNARSDLDAPNSPNPLIPKRLFEGDGMCRLTLGTLQKIPRATRWSTGTALPLDFSATLTNPNGDAIVITASGQFNTSSEVALEAESNPVEYSYGFECAYNSATALDVTVTPA